MMSGGSPEMVEELKANIKSACANTLSMFINEIEHLSNPKGTKFAGRPFQIFGFDVLIDNKLKCWILEINDHPSLNII